MRDTYFETLGQAVHGAILAADDRWAILKDPGSAREIMGREPISYGQMRNFDFELVTLRERKTKKWYHVVITRLDSGRYELVTYVL
jgi:hypothetical protein